jgi:beta-mannosidase
MRYPCHFRQELRDGWGLAWDSSSRHFPTLKALQQSGLPLIPASVPGNFEIDLERAGIEKDLLLGMGITAVRKYERNHVWYACRFPSARTGPAGQQAFLIFEGSDCFATYYLNGDLLGESDNALVEHEFEVTGLLRLENDLVVHFRPASIEAKKFDYPAHAATFQANYDSLYVRKPPHVYGWDIMPRALSVGLWRPVSLVWRPKERLEQVFLRTLQADGRTASLNLHIRAHLGNSPDDIYEIELDGQCGTSAFSQRQRLFSDAGRIAFSLDQPCLWWPRGRGSPALYQVVARLLKNGEQIDRAEFRHGIRLIELRRSSITDERGSGEFVFHVNGEKVFILGTNHVPADVFHSRDPEQLPGILAMVEDLGCNMIRCWGGNVYEPDSFFDLCDEKGILVWQDFALGCAVYPRDTTFQETLRREAVRVVRRLREHACLALWAGDNECDDACNWFAAGDPNRNTLTRGVLAEVVATEDPGRGYLPSSPFIDEKAHQAGSNYLPENHLWGPRDNYKSDFYKNSLAHFASEIGYHGCPGPSSVKRFISSDKLWPAGNEEWILHGTSPIPGYDSFDYRIELMFKQVREIFGVRPENLEDFAALSQWVQAEALKFFIELFRGSKWRRTGIIWWNLRDGWPQFSDAVVDYYNVKKAAYAYIQRAQQPLLVMLREPNGSSQEAVVCNDTRDDLNLRYAIRESGTGEMILEGNIRAHADSVTPIGSFDQTRSEARFFVIEWECPLGKGRNHYLSGNSPFDATQYRAWLEQTY